MPASPFERFHTVIGRLVRSADFERVLRTRSQASSTHFALHHLAVAPSRPAKPAKLAAKIAVAAELSTRLAPIEGEPVDDSGRNASRTLDSRAVGVAVASASTPGSATAAEPPAAAPDRPTGLWLGAVVPKRHARRSVTRSLLKRQIRSALGQHEPALAAGLWVVRLRAPFDRQQFPSAASTALRAAAGAELDQLVRQWLARASRSAAAGR